MFPEKINHESKSNYVHQQCKFKNKENDKN